MHRIYKKNEYFQETIASVYKHFRMGYVYICIYARDLYYVISRSTCDITHSYTIIHVYAQFTLA